jgi:integrase
MTNSTSSEAPRRANGEGSVFRSASRGWVASITLNGRRKTLKAPIQTKAGAKELLRDLLRQRDDGVIARHSMTLTAYLPEFLAAARLRGCRPRSLEAYEDRLRKHVLPTLGRVRLDKLTSGQIERLYAAMAADGKSAATIGAVHTVLNAVLKHGKRRGVVGRNVCELVERPKVPKYEAHPLSLDDARRLLTAIAGHRYQAFWTFLIGTGTRFGEAAGLTWANLDLDTGIAVIRQAVGRVRSDGKSHLEITPVKTAAGVRTLPLPLWVVDALRAQRARVAELRLAAGPVWNDQDLVFPSGDGRPLNETTVWEAWTSVLKQAGLPHVRMHDLRHSFATIALDNGEDLLAVSRSLGHARIAITSDLYAGRVPAAQRRLVERYGELLAGTN